MRYTKQFIQARFRMAMDAIGATHGDAYLPREDGNGYRPNDGAHFIDHAPIYGGYRIARMSSGGGESAPFGSGRHSAREFVALLDGILGAARHMQERS